MGPCENEKPQALGWNIRGLGTHRASYRRWPKPRASCTDGSSLAKKGARVVCGEARLALSGQKPRASCAVGSQSRDRRHPRAEFPQFRMPLQRGVRARDSGPRGESLENSSPRAIFGQLARATRGVHERRLNLEAVRSSRGCNEGDDGVVRGWEAQSREARAALVPLPGL